MEKNGRRKVTWSSCVLPMTSSLGLRPTRAGADSSRNSANDRAVWLEPASRQTRLIEFGRHADKKSTRPGDGNAESLQLSGLPAHQRETRKGWFTVLRPDDAPKRWQAKVRRCESNETTLATIRPGSGPPTAIGRHGAYRILRGAHERSRASALPKRNRSHLAMDARAPPQQSRMSWSRSRSMPRGWLPHPAICHPYPSWDRRHHPRQEPDAVIAPCSARICGGGYG